MVLGMICDEVLFVLWDSKCDDVQIRKESGPMDWNWKFVFIFDAIVLFASPVS